MASSTAAIFGTVVSQLGKLIAGPVKESYDYIGQYAENIGKVQENEEKLRKHRDDMDEEVKQGKEKGEEITSVTEQWLFLVETLLNDNKLKRIVEMDLQRRTREDECCLGVCHVNLYHRYKWSKIAQVKVYKIQERLNDVPRREHAVTRPLSILKVRSKIDEYMSHGLKSREEIIHEIVDKLVDDDQAHVVGLFGTEAVGKTKMVKEIMKDEKVIKAFNKRTAMIEVSETPNMKGIQDKMVEVIDEGLKELDHVELRAMLLYIKLKTNQNRKILIILDDICGKINLNKLGILAAKHCKILVVSRMKNVCKAMQAKDCDIFEMKPLSLDEARYLFWTQVYYDKEKMVDQVTSWDYIYFGDKLLKNYCRGLPLAVLAIAKVLRDQSLSQWHNFAAELDTKGREVFYSIWEKNFQILDNTPDKKMFFLLTCLFPTESSISIQELMRYAMGLELIQCVNNLAQAIKLANTWAHQLISSSLLEVDDDSKTVHLNVIIPRLVREHAISLLDKEGHKFMVEAIPRWHTQETCQKYTAISLKPDCNHSRLSELKSNNLQMLILNGSQPHQFPDTFFRGMTNLKVLVLKGMKLIPNVPDSIGTLNNLRLLRLEGCELGGFNWVDMLVNLIVLSFRASDMDELPAEVIRNCSNLRLLDLTNCKIMKGIPANVLGKLSQLEGFYGYDSFENWASDNLGEIASIDELNNLDYLNVLEINARHPQQFPLQGDNFVMNLDQFYICVGDRVHQDKKLMSRTLQFRSITDVSSVVNSSCLKELMKKSEMLRLERIGKLQQFIDIKDVFKFQYLQNLEIIKCFEMQYFSFYPFKAPNLNDLRVASCPELSFFFMELDYDIEIPNLKVMVLNNLLNLETMLAGTNCFNANKNDLQGQVHQDEYQAFFSRKITFPSLEVLELESCNQIVQLWDFSCEDNQYMASFNNLKEICIWNCAKLEGLVSFSIAVALDQLKELTISDCPLIKEVITKEEVEDDAEHKYGEHLIFRSLKKIRLERCCKLQVFSSGNKDQTVKLPELQNLKIYECSEMQSFSTGPFKAPNLSKLRVRECERFNIYGGVCGEHVQEEREN